MNLFFTGENSEEKAAGNAEQVDPDFSTRACSCWFFGITGDCTAIARRCLRNRRGTHFNTDEPISWIQSVVGLPFHSQLMAFVWRSRDACWQPVAWSTITIVSYDRVYRNRLLVFLFLIQPGPPTFAMLPVISVYFFLGMVVSSFFFGVHTQNYKNKKTVDASNVKNSWCLKCKKKNDKKMRYMCVCLNSKTACEGNHHCQT